MIKSIRQLIEILDPASRLHFALLIIPMLLITLLEIASIGLVVPVIQVLILGQQDGQLTRFILDILPVGDGGNTGLWVTGVFAVFFIIKNVLLLTMFYIINKVVAFKTAVYARNIFDSYLGRPMEFHFHNNSATLLFNITAGVDRSLDAVRLSLFIILDTMLMAGAFILLIYVEPTATLSAAFVLGVVGISVYAVSSPVFRFWGEESRKLETTLIKLVNQSLEGIRIVKLMQARDYLREKIEDTVMLRARYYSRSMTAAHIPRLLFEAIVVIGFLGIVLMLVSAEQNPTDIVGVLGLFGMAALRLMPSLNRLMTSATEMRKSSSHIEKIHEAFTAGTEEKSYPDTGVAHPGLSFEREIHIKEISYTYPDAQHSVLHDIDIVIKKGESVGFVGPSGGGKSTLMDIILGLLKPENGQLLVDGKDAFEYLAGWQRQIGFVPQQLFLMDDSFRCNIAFAIRDEDIDEGRVIKVLEMSQLDSFVDALPEGLSTVLGERGTRLSGGQRQRVAIARALYRDPEVLMFDEATSALDYETEYEIRRTIESLAGEKTLLICAHRLSTVRNCDRLVFMKEGRIAGIGSHEKLLESNADYQRLCRLENLDFPKNPKGTFPE